MQVSQILTENKKVSSKFLAVVFGYMFIGLLITALTAFLFPLAIINTPAFYSNGTFTDSGANLVLGVGIASAVGALIDSLVISIYSAKSGKAPWVGFILYALLLGFSLSLVLFAGVDFYTIGEAFGITALCFGVMFLIGYFSPVDLTPMAFIALALFGGLLLIGITFSIYYAVLVAQGAWNAASQSAFQTDLLCSVIIVIAAMLITGYDANRMGKMVETGITNRNIALFCAFSLYCDFIMIFIRVLYILILAKNQN